MRLILTALCWELDSWIGNIPKICTILQGVCAQEGLTYCAPLGQEIALKSERNLRRALLMLETCRVQK